MNNEIKPDEKLLTKFNFQINERIQKLRKKTAKYDETIKSIIANQEASYILFNESLQKNGSELTSFILTTVDVNGKETTQDIFGIEYLFDFLKSGLVIELIDELNNPILYRVRDNLICNILSLTIDPTRKYLYGPTIRTIFKIVEFYDILIRTLGQEPAYYHKYRYERYVEYCISCSKDGLILLPTCYNIGVTDLLKMRGYPLFPIGISMTKLHVDEFQQTPAEFFVHDINHSRRMFEENLKHFDEIKSKYTSILNYYNDCDKFSKQIIELINNNFEAKKNASIGIDDNIGLYDLPFFDINTHNFITKKYKCLTQKGINELKNGQPIDKGYSQIIKIIIFEITHEDALPIHPEIICSNITRGSGNNPLFPRLTQTNKGIEVIALSDEGASILSFVKYKLRYGFFDIYPTINELAVYSSYRTDKRLAIATKILLDFICNNAIEMDKLLTLITDKTGLNPPVHMDNLYTINKLTNKSHYSDILEDRDFGDLSEEDIKQIRLKYGLPQINEFSGIRPKPVSEQNTRNEIEQYRKGLDPRKILSIKNNNANATSGGYYKNTKNTKIKKNRKSKKYTLKK
jgi:hypothetical protein